MPPADLSSIQASLDSINARLDKLEAKQNVPQLTTSNPHLSHPSLDKFSIAEAIADWIFASKGEEKACTLEPSKPCDHCSMCSSRGF